MSHDLNPRFSVESGDNVVQHVDMHHCRFSVVHYEHNKSPEPSLSSHADMEVILGKKPWPAVDITIIEKEPTICVICGIDFKMRSNLQVHLSDHQHLMGKIDRYKKIPLYLCKLCAAEVNCTTVLRHRCFMKHQAEISDVEELMNNKGSPLVCIFCRGRIMPSRAHLIAHLISAHSPHRNPLRCVFCHVRFQSDSLLMQETHIFTHHVPELIFFDRLAYFKEIKGPSGQVVDPKVPFLCLFDPRKMEESCWIDAIPQNVGHIPRTSDGIEVVKRTQLGPKQGVCYARFDNLAEYTAHVYCCHAVVPHARDLESELNSSELKRLDATEWRIPGPTIRQLMSGQPSAGGSGATKIDATHAANIRGRTKPKPGVGGNLINTNVLSKWTCRICLRDYVDEDGLKKHLSGYHIPEAQKRVQHLTETGKLSKVLDMDRLCTECFTIYRSVYQLQVHIMVAHGGNSWISCGSCGQRFCELNKCLPSNLTIGGPLDNSDENQNMNSLGDPSGQRNSPEPPSVESNPSLAMDMDLLHAPYETPLPVLTLCRILETHEAKHRDELTPAKKVPFLPARLITQLLESRGHQGKQVSDWLSKAYSQPAHLDIKPFTYEDPNAPHTSGKARKTVKMKPGQDPLSPEGVEQSLKLLEILVLGKIAGWKPRDSDLDNEAETLEARTRQKERPLAGSGYSIISGSISKESSSADASLGGSRGKIIKIFTQIGERNAAKQQEKDFAETL